MVYVVTNRNKRTRGGKPSFGGRAGEISYLLNNGEPQVVEPAEFRRELLEDLEGGQQNEPARIVGVIHGYNVSWRRSVEFARMVDQNLTQKLRMNAVTVLFSWPSQGNVASYLDDRGEAEAAALPFATVIEQALRVAGEIRCPAQMCLIAHSMGNHLLAHAANKAWVARGMPREGNLFSEILLVAPDLDAEALEDGKIGSAIPIFARRVHVYASRADGPLALSSGKRLGLTGNRLGRSGPARPDAIASNVVTIDATEQTQKGEVGAHGDHFRDEIVCADMIQVLESRDRRLIEGRVSTRVDNKFELAGNADDD